MSDIKNFDRMFRLDGKVALVTGGKTCLMTALEVKWFN